MTPIAFICPNLSENCLGRTLLLAQLAADNSVVRMVGPQLGSNIWAPATTAGIPIDALRIKGTWELPRASRWLRQRLRGHRVVVTKPLATSLGLTVAAGVRPSEMLLDNDDWELGLHASHGASGMGGRLAAFAKPKAFNTWVSTWAIERTLGRFQNVTVSSEFLQERFGGTILPHVRDTDVLNPDRVSTPAAKHKLGLDDRVWVGFVGTPRSHKGVEDLVDAIASLRDASAPGLLLAGADPTDQFAERLLPDLRARLPRERLAILPPFPFNELVNVLSAVDIVCLPSRDEPGARGQMPAKLFDAMAMGRGLIVTTVNGMPDVLGGAGLVVNPGDVAGLRGALERLSKDGDLRRDLGMRARQRAVDRYSFRAGRAILNPKLARLSGVFCP